MSEANYKKQIRAAVRGLWTGAFTFEDFDEIMKGTIRRGMTQAWIEGAKPCGITLEDLSDAESLALAQIISSQFDYIDGFRDFVDANSKVNKGKLGQGLARAELWINRYGEARNQAKAMACSDRKLKWQINAKCREHCKSCTRLNGKVKRGSYWQKTIMPRSKNLECGGWRCCCELIPTDDPISKGKLSF